MLVLDCCAPDNGGVRKVAATLTLALGASSSIDLVSSSSTRNLLSICPGRSRSQLLRQRRPYFGQRDRGWKKEVFGKMLYTTPEAYERKSKPEEYVERVERLIKEGLAEAL